MSDKAKQQDRHRRLGSHRGGVAAPTTEEILRFAFTQNGHRFLRVGARRQLSDADCQMYVRDPYGGSFNVVRLLLERAELFETGRKWENQCGFSECIDLKHWKPTLPPPRGRAGRLLIRIDEHGTPSLHLDGDEVRRDMTFPALIQPLRDVAHLARFLYEANRSRFVTACGINIAPVTVVPCDKVKCERCLT